MNSADNSYQNRAIPTTGILTLSVIKWEKHNLRSDRPSMAWFKMATGFYTDAKVMLLNRNAMNVLIFCYAEQGKNSGKPFELMISYASLLNKLTSTELVKSLQELQIAGFIRVGVSLVEDGIPTVGISPPNGVLEERRGEEIRGDAVAAPPADPLEDLIIKFSKIHADEAWVRKELKKAQTWIVTHPGRKLTEKFFAKWLSNGLDSKPLPPKLPEPKAPELYWDGELHKYVEADSSYKYPGQV